VRELEEQYSSRAIAKELGGIVTHMTIVNYRMRSSIPEIQAIQAFQRVYGLDPNLLYEKEKPRPNLGDEACRRRMSDRNGDHQ
jgi:hypothetical protein